MNFQELQKEVDDWVSQFDTKYWPPLSQLARLTEEVGELARIFNTKFGPKVIKEEDKLSTISEELGDILLTICFIANAQGVDLSEAAKKIVNKFHKRDTANVLKAERENA